MTELLPEHGKYGFGQRRPILGDPARLARAGHDGRYRRVREREVKAGGFHADAVR